MSTHAKCSKASSPYTPLSKASSPYTPLDTCQMLTGISNHKREKASSPDTPPQQDEVLRFRTIGLTTIWSCVICASKVPHCSSLRSDFLSLTPARNNNNNRGHSLQQLGTSFP
ncbi:hypothetical protein PIB30_047070 [Stylosanthes scabra]|uniref:Uncharacterized protein n=1 Tax=Stylosanthes scabra TaxID=79078 RepID=A0ABU6VHC5_9FABA|nr:hypothetical protein [Stylosanthes scabra]